METMMRKKIDLVELQRTAKERTVKTQNIEYDLETIVRRIKNGHIKLDPEYQRNHRWTDDVSSRLIESLILNIPIPTIYLSQDFDADEEIEENIARFSVVDGQQRLTAIKSFLENELCLTDMEVLKDLNGCYYEELPGFLKRRLDERTIKFLRIDSTLDTQVKYDIFERLNTGSVKLEAQELRNALYRGDFNNFMKKLALNESFMSTLQIKKSERNKNKKVEKMEDIELILRFLSFYNKSYKSYKPNMKEFLSDSMGKINSEFNKEKFKEMLLVFLLTIRLIEEYMGKFPFAKFKFAGLEESAKKFSYASRFNTAIYDVVTVAFADEIVLKYADLKIELSNLDNMYADIKDFNDTEINFPEFEVIYADFNERIKSKINFSNLYNKYISLFAENDFVNTISGSTNDKSKIESRIERFKSLIRGETFES